MGAMEEALSRPSARPVKSPKRAIRVRGLRRSALFSGSFTWAEITSRASWIAKMTWGVNCSEISSRAVSTADRRTSSVEAPEKAGMTFSCRSLAARRALHYEVIEVKAEWDKYGKAAGPIRNRKMLSMSQASLRKRRALMRR